VSLRLQLDLCSVLFSRSFSQGRRQPDKDCPPHGIKWFSAPTISTLLLLEIRVFRGLKLLRTHYTVNRSAMSVGGEVTLPTNGPIRAPALLRQLCPPLCLPMELILYPESLPDRVTPYPIFYLDSYPRLCPIPYPSRYLEPYPSRYPSHTQRFS
jgi:hypothetical protein